jgi:hypothetical protein
MSSPCRFLITRSDLSRIPEIARFIMRSTGHERPHRFAHLGPRRPGRGTGISNRQGSRRRVGSPLRRARQTFTQGPPRTNGSPRGLELTAAATTGRNKHPEPTMVDSPSEIRIGSQRITPALDRAGRPDRESTFPSAICRFARIRRSECRPADTSSRRCAAI